MKHFSEASKCVLKVISEFEEVFEPRPASVVKSYPRLQRIISPAFAYGCLTLFFGLLIILPVLREATSVEWIAMFDSFYWTGSLVFGGGHVVLPLLEREFVTLTHKYL